jgi:hypothetical protein
MTDEISVEPFLFRLSVEQTPSPNDPEGAADLYKAIGIMVVAWGRLEGHFVAALLTMMAISGDELGHQLPMNWRARGTMWRKAFETLPYLTAFKPSGLQFLTQVETVALQRHAIVHALWEKFSDSNPVTIGTVIIRHRNKTPDGLEISRAAITSEMVTEIARKANDLNLLLTPLSQFLAMHRSATSPPPADIRII